MHERKESRMTSWFWISATGWTIGLFVEMLDRTGLGVHLRIRKSIVPEGWDFWW